MEPKLYHAHHQLYIEDLPFWQELAAKKTAAILELGCGTGRVMLPMHRSGRRIFGLDLDIAMLKLLKAEEGGAQVFQADLRQFHLGIQFSLIYLACNTWSTFSADERQQALECIDQHLAPGGIFTASLPNPGILLDLEDNDPEEAEDSFTHPESGNPVQVSSAWQVDRREDTLRRVTFFWHYDHLLPDGAAERVTHTTSHWVVPASRLVEEFSTQGWRTRTLGGFQKEPYDDSSPYLIIQGEKI